MNQDLMFSLPGYGIVTAIVFIIAVARVFTPDWEGHSREDACLVLLAWAWPALVLIAVFLALRGLVRVNNVMLSYS